MKLPSLAEIGIQKQVIAVAAVTCTVSLVLSTCAFIGYDWLTYRGQLSNELKVLADVTGSNSAAALDFMDASNAEEALEALRRNQEHILCAALYDATGTKFAAFSRVDAGDCLPANVSSIGSIAERSRLSVVRPVRNRDEQVGTIYLVSDLKQVDQRIANYLLITIIVLSIAFASAVGLSAWLQRYITQPILHLADVARRVSETRDYSIRAQTTCPADLAALVAGFNDMLERVAEREREGLHVQEVLEQRVAERTHDLTRANAELRHAKDAAEAASRAALTSERRYRELFENATDAILTIDPTGEITDANRAGAELLGEQCDDLPGKNVGSFFVSDDWDRLRTSAISHEHGSSPLQIRATIGGRHKTLECSARLLTDGADTMGIQIMARDATERIETEQALRQMQKMEAVGRLAGGISHDFNNILMAISGYSELMTFLATDDRQRKYADEIMKAAKRGSSLTAQLLAYSRKQIVQRKPLEMNTLVAGSVGMLRRLVGEDIDFRFESSRSPAWFEGDASQMEQVLLNLVVNARDAIGSGGTLTIRTENVSLTREDLQEHHSFVPPGRYACLQVIDTGIGMSDDVKAHLFEPFFTTKPKGKGTGLGLATVYGIVKQSVGYVLVESEVGKGTRVQVLFPNTETRAQAVAPPAVVTTETGNEKILLVEDDDNVRVPLVEFLSSRGYNVVCASNGAEALEVVKGEGIQLLVSDIVMPGISGPQLAERLKLDDPELKVLFISGYTDDRLPGGGEGVELLQKPFSFSDLQRRVRRILDTRVPVATPA